jgi:uncharacterized protein (DUF1697 family)
MPRYVALLRAVNVGGTGKLPLSALEAMCEELGFTQVETYIASGNVVFDSAHSEVNIQSLLEQRLHAYAGKAVGVHVRSAAALRKVLASNPFPDTAGNRNLVIFLNDAPPGDVLTKATGLADEKIALGTREIYVHYVDGMGTSKLKIPAAKFGTARNMNTVAKLVDMTNG